MLLTLTRLRLPTLAWLSLLFVGFSSYAQVSLYLPLNQNAGIESDIEKLVTITSAPGLKRPYPVNQIRHYAEQITEAYPSLYARIDTYLKRYEQDWALTDANVELSLGHGEQSLANARGQKVEDNFQASIRGHWRATDWAAASLGAHYTQANQLNPTETFVALGFDWMQLDVGMREHWYSPFNDSSMLMSTHAQVSPSITLSNSEPLTPWRFQYELFYSKLEEVDCIRVKGECRQDRPELLSFQLSLMPVDWWQIGITRNLQYGGDGVDRSWSDILEALVCPTCVQSNANGDAWGNQLMSIQSRFNIDVGQPMSVYFEYGGEDTANDRDYELGNITMGAGVYLPMLTSQSSLRVEWNSWQSQWYNHWMYQNGFTNNGNVMGHWGAGNRKDINEGVGANAFSFKYERMLSNQEQLFTTLRYIKNDSYYSDYSPGFELDMMYSFNLFGYDVAAGFLAGRDTSKDSYGRVYAQYHL
ncbi:MULTISPECIES: capsule assembly Wzi family protein [unclassified Agarivorans]|uniref:capsule assembly Wzi family protein n=1 Tax=unclassified Agarivorans TaxID=2636026 RepID=UPI0026E2214C|nr:MULTISPECIES: capsule assembly Wzi family protein [unclassified Agarivorans]MDO6685717.1 capsule assembly Wzi family protein [Agarivorans sp. 3_MG-2023]MDO6716168.1 capsule assembly Wzi family protein [Agarivorans sp. 2_MG-2023]